MIITRSLIIVKALRRSVIISVAIISTLFSPSPECSVLQTISNIAVFRSLLRRTDFIRRTRPHLNEFFESLSESRFP